MIGVDIIDRSCSFNSGKYTLEDYKQKILNKSEFLFCNSFSDLDCLWAIKESAYKCFYKEGGQFFLNPHKILITRLDWSLSSFSVCIHNEFYSGKFYITEEFIYSICSDNEINNLPEIFVDSTKNTSILIEELNFYTPQPNIENIFQHHIEGFPVGLTIGDRHYAYSRSHHGNYYISAILPVSGLQ